MSRRFVGYRKIILFCTVTFTHLMLENLVINNVIHHEVKKITERYYIDSKNRTPI